MEGQLGRRFAEVVVAEDDLKWKLIVFKTLTSDTSTVRCEKNELRSESEMDCVRIVRCLSFAFVDASCSAAHMKKHSIESLP